MKLNKFKRGLVLAPHTDDGELGAGGTINRMIDEGNEVHYVAFSTAEESVPNNYPKNILEIEVKRATKTLGIEQKNLHIFKHKVRKLNYVRQEILEDLVKLKKQIKPDLVLMPSLNDIHQDHTTVAHEGLRAFKNTSIFAYELLWNNITFETRCFVKLSNENVDAKFKALKEYKSQSSRDYMQEDFVYSHAITRGVQSGCKYAECFEVVRLIL